MASVISNLVYRVSVSAIIGAVVAGGLIYLNNDRVVKSYRAEQALQTEQQDMTNKALMEANDYMATSITIMEAEQAQQFTDFSDALRALEAKIDAIPVAEAADFSEIIGAIDALNADLTAKIEALDTATPEQN